MSPAVATTLRATLTLAASAHLGEERRAARGRAVILQSLLCTAALGAVAVRLALLLALVSIRPMRLPAWHAVLGLLDPAASELATSTSPRTRPGLVGGTRSAPLGAEWRAGVAVTLELDPTGWGLRRLGLEPTPLGAERRRMHGRGRAA